MTTQFIDWLGMSGKIYRHTIYPINTQWNPVPGNYVFATEVRPGHWKPIYVGETENFQDRFIAHHAIDRAKRQGATHIHALVNKDGRQARLNVETDLRRRWDPPCNKQ